MKYKAHIPTETYGFIEIESDDLEEITGEYFSIKSQFQGRDGLNVKEWAQVRRKYLEEGEIEVEDMEKLNKSQRFVINEIKKTFQQIKRD